MIDEENQTLSWDWNEQLPADELNVLLKPYGVEVVNVDNQSDQYEIRVRPAQP